MSLSPDEAKALATSVKTLQKQGPKIATEMYDKFYAANPELTSYFSICFLGKDHKAGEGAKITLMAKVMAHILFQFILNIEREEQFKADLEKIAAKHVSRMIKPEFFPLLREALCTAVSDALGDKATPECMAGWRKGYDKMAGILIQMQVDMEADLKKKPNTWEGFRKFKLVAPIEATTETIGQSSSGSSDSSEDEGTGFEEKVYKMILTPVDAGALPEVDKFGQYVALRLTVDGKVTHRNYNIAAVEGGNWVFALRENVGKVCFAYFNTLKVGDEVEVSQPTGSFLLLESLS
mmetsp:Transcript_13344/g.35490  ORF Transcript_13344/g.35490 Transcript_13344/m.35490 type:complete len:293 (-) Transcript_13344:180-1058(-)